MNIHQKGGKIIKSIKFIAIIFVFLILVTPSYASDIINPTTVDDYCLMKDRPMYIKEVQLSTYPNPDKVAYLTFDDGPTPGITAAILDILNENGIRATFFTIGKSMEKYPELTKRIINEGHIIANHSYSHNYNVIYSGLEGFENEINAWTEVAKSVLGEDFDSKIFRFPGGSHNKGQSYKDRVVELGYSYYDWNALNGDSELKDASMSHLKNRTNETVKNQAELVFLMHDAGGKNNTVNTLEDIIHLLRTKGYAFNTLDEIIQP